MTSADHRPFPKAQRRLPIRLSVPRTWERPALYVLETLLAPLALDPDPDAGGQVGLYYGEGEAPEGWIDLPFDGRAPAFFAGRNAAGAAGEGFAPDRLRDPVAACFYWLSGWDEWTIRARDRFGRPRTEDNWLVRTGTSDRAPVDEVRDDLAERLRPAAGRRLWAGRNCVLCPTHDVDYLRKWRPGIIYREAVQYLLRNARGVGGRERLLRASHAARAALRLEDVFRESVRRMGDAVHERGGTATWFFKAGAHGPHDVAYRLARARPLIEDLVRQGHEIGLHPSFHAFDHPEYLKKEAHRLERAAGPLRSARTHYLRGDVATPGLLSEAGFVIDSSLGFADRAGFRRGTCLPFRPWDHAVGAPADLWELPLAVMESALFNREGLDAEAAVERTEALLATARRHRGALVVLWHNTLWDDLDYPGWRTHFLETLNAADGAVVSGLSEALAHWE